MIHAMRWWCSLCLLSAAAWAAESQTLAQPMKSVRISSDRRGFVREDNASPFVLWGFNYDHDEAGRLLEDYWTAEWPKVQEDFAEMKALGANVVRIHLQVGKFLRGPQEPNESALNRLGRLLDVAERLGLYLDVTGLACYHKKDVPSWYDSLPEEDRWGVQARFWEAVAGRCAASSAVFCYDLMNEPILPGDKPETEWLTGELGGKFFVQRIALDLAGRRQPQVAKAWVDRLVTAIRRRDQRHLITVGVIPWALYFPGAKPLFYSPEVAENLDFASVHFYPEQGEIEQALAALAGYDIGKPLVIEEIFPLKCSADELELFIGRSRGTADGWIGFYWGRTLEECRRSKELADALTAGWLELFQRKASQITGSKSSETSQLRDCLPPKVSFLKQLVKEMPRADRSYVADPNNRWTRRAHNDAFDRITKTIERDWLPPDPNVLRENLVMIQNALGPNDVTYSQWELRGHLMQVAQMGTIILVCTRPISPDRVDRELTKEACGALARSTLSSLVRKETDFWVYEPP